MPTQRLTDKGLTSLKAPQRGRRDYSDSITPGLHLRVSASGERTWAFRYKPKGSQVSRRLTLGPLSDHTLADAREWARGMRQQVGLARDPREDQKREREAARVEELRHKTDTFEALATKVMEKFEGKLDERSTRPEWWRKLRVDVFPVMGKKRPAEITRADVKALIDAKAKSAPYAALRVFEVVRWVFTRALEEEWVASSPCVGLKKDRFAKERPREKVYTDEELRALLAFAASESGAEYRLRFVVPLIAHTGVRLDEALSVEWGDLDLDRALWTIPPAKTKTEDAHPVPLSAGALQVLADIREARGGASDGWLFPARVGGGYMDDPDYPKGLKTALGYKTGERAMVCHDLRRTVATRLAAAGTRQEVVDAVMGHRQPKLVRTYQKHTYLPETRAALGAWSDELDRIVAIKPKRAAGKFEWATGDLQQVPAKRPR